MVTLHVVNSNGLMYVDEFLLWSEVQDYIEFAWFDARTDELFTYIGVTKEGYSRTWTKDIRYPDVMMIQDHNGQRKLCYFDGKWDLKVA